MDDVKQLIKFLVNKITVPIVVLFLSINALSQTYQLGDLAPRGAPDGQLNAADSLILQQILLGDIVPTQEEKIIGDVAPLGAPDNVLNAGDLVIQSQAVLGNTILGTIDITPLPAPVLTVKGKGGVISTTDNPYFLTGKASKNASIDIYVNDVFQQRVYADQTKGTFSIDAYLLDGINDIYAVEVAGLNTSPLSNVIQVQYDSVVDKNNLPSTISTNTVWTVGETIEPYVISSNLVIASGVTLVLQPGVSVIFEDRNATLSVKGSLFISGTSDNKVLLSGSIQIPGQNWNGIDVESGGYVIINHAIIEYAKSISYLDANSGVYFSSGSRGSVSNTLIQYCRNGIEVEGRTSPTIGPNNIIINNEYGVYVTDGNRSYIMGNPKPNIFSNIIFDNTDINIFVDADYIDEGGEPINARGNYWGSTNLSDITATIFGLGQIDFSGYLDEDGNVAPTEILLQGSITTDTLLFENTVYDVLGVLKIAENTTLTVPKGSTLKFAKGSGMNVYGSLITIGTEFEPVTLTTGKYLPTKGSWGSITVKDGGYVGIDYSVIEYGYNNFSFLDGSDGTVSNSIIRNSSNIGISIYRVSPTITNNIITQNGRFEGGGIVFESVVDAATNPIIKYNKIFDNFTPVDFYRSYDGDHNAFLDMRENYWGSTDINEIYMNECGGGGYRSYGPCLDYRDYLDENGDIVEINSLLGVLSENVTLLPNTTYEVLSYFEIPEGITLTIPAGVKLNFYNKSQDLVVLGELISSGIPTNPVVFTSGKIDPAQRDWSGIDVRFNGFLSMEYTVVQYADRAVNFSGSNVGGNITNSIIEESNIGLEDYSDASNVNISNTLFRLNYTGIDVPGPSSPFIGPANTIKDNRYGIYLRQKSNLNPSPSIAGNYIFNNAFYNINVNNFIGGNTVTVDVRGNYWGTDDPVKIASKMNQTSSLFPVIDFSGYILKADVPPNTGSNIVGQELLLCPVVHKLDDTDFVDNVPDENIEWIGSNYSDVNEIEKAFNNARAIDSSIFKYLKMPIQESWEGMSVQEQGLYLINAERHARGLKPYEGLSQNVTVIIQGYTDYIMENNQVIGHYNDGKTPAQRLDENSIILENRDANVKLENGFATYWDAPVLSDSEAIVMAVYYWIYYDMFPLVGDAWGHRGSILQTGLYENSGETYKEGLIGFGVSSGEYNPGSANSVPNGTVVFVNIIDPSSTWDHSTTLAVDTDSAQLCNDNIVITIDETSVSDVSRVISLEISPSDIFLSPGGTEQLKIVANYEAPLRQKDVTSIANFNADAFSVVNIEAGYITALKNGDIRAMATVNGVTSNSIIISVRDKTDTSNFTNTEAKNYLTHLPDNASIAQYDTNAFGVFTGYVDDKYDRPLNDVIVSVFNKPEYGSVKTDINGRFNFATNAGERTFVYRKSGYLTVHRSAAVASNAWAAVDDVTLLKVDSKESAINLTASTPQIHKSTEITDTFGTRSTTLVFNGVTSATVTSTDGSQRSLENFLVRATEYELPKSMPAELPKESAFTYCSELQVAGVRDDETVNFDNDVVMYVDNFLGFNVGEIVPIGYYDRQLGDWVASDNGIVVKLLDSDSDGLVDGLDMSGDDVADDLNGNGSTEDEVAGIESYTPEATYWRGAFNHFTPYDFNWPFVPPLDATNPGDVKAETSNNDKDKNECTRVGSYVKPETQSFHEDIPITGTDLALHYSSQRTSGYKHKFNVQVSGNTISPSMIEMIAKLEIGGNVFEQTYEPTINIEAEFVWDGNDPTGKRIKGIVSGLLSIGYRYNSEYSSAGSVTSPSEFEAYATAWAKVGTTATGATGLDDFITWNSSAISVQNTFDNQFANGWSISNHHLSSSIGNIYQGNGEVIDSNKTSLILKTGIQLSQHIGDDGYYQKGGNEIDYEISRFGTLIDNVTGLEWQYTDTPEKFITKTEASNYCSSAEFTTDSTGWRLPTDKEITYTVDKSGAEHPVEIYNILSVNNIWNTNNNNPEKLLIPVYCVRGEKLNDKYVSNLIRDYTLEVVVDKDNGLMWLDDSTAVSNKRNWADSIDYCEALSHASYEDWRLPNINELTYVLPNSVFINETNYTDPFWGPTAANRNPYWSSTPYAGFTSYAWAMESIGFNSPGFNVDDLYHVRCVRDNIQSVPGPYRFDANGRHTETVDPVTGITLQAFVYDINGTLRSITDRFGDAITITGDPEVDGYYQITTQDGYTTTVNINVENEVSSVNYEDGTSYDFTYADGALLETKTEPNGNVFIHTFDLVDGRVTQTTNQEGGSWGFFSNRIGDSGALYGYTTAELNTYQTQRNILNNGDVNKSTTLFDGTILSDLNQADDLKQTLQSCLVTTVIDKVIDSKTKQPIPSAITVTQPSGLENLTTITKTFGADGADFTQQTITTAQNGKPDSTVYTNSTTGETIITSAEGRTTTLNTDPDTLLLQSSQTPGLFDTTYTYDSRGRQETITIGTRTTTFVYDPVSKGDVTYIESDDGKRTYFEYDVLGRVNKIIYPDTHYTENSYDDKGNLTQRVVPTLANHDFTHNKVNKVKTQTRPKDVIISEVTQYDYDKERNLTKVTLPSTKVINHIYLNGLINSTTTPEGTINYSYTCNKKVESITDGIEGITYGYDGSLLEEITYAGSLNKAINYSYNNNFEVESLAYADQTTSYGYDDDGLLTNINTGADQYVISRNPDNGLPEQLSNTVLVHDRQYNGHGEADNVTTRVAAQDIYDYTLTYNDLGQITNKTEALGDGTVNTYVYSYDDRRRLDTVTKNSSLIEDYDYDENGNRTQQTNILRSIAAQSAVYNIGDQLVSAGSTDYDYDADGYLQRKTEGSDVTSYQYDTQGRLKQVVTPTQTITYKHNSLGNRVEKQIDGEVVEKYLWLDKTTLLAIYDKDNVLLQRYQYTDGNTPTSFVQYGETYYIVTDHLGSPKAVVDSSGSIVKTIERDSFGNVISDSNPAFSIPFGFAGGLYDKDTRLTRFGFRDYDADTGRWTARDPVGFGGGDTNLYGYTSNDPVNFTDPNGLFACGGFCIAGIAASAYFTYEAVTSVMDQGEQMQQHNANLDKFLKGDVGQVNNLQDYNRNLAKNTAETHKDVSMLTHLSNSFLDNLQKLLALISKLNEDEKNTKNCKNN